MYPFDTLMGCQPRSANEGRKVMRTCPNGHTNPDNQDFCGECRAPIMLAVAICPRGHTNPEHAHFCEECGVPLTPPVAPVPASSKARPWYRKTWVIAVASIITIAVIAGGVVAVVATTAKKQHTSSAPTTSAAVAMKNWWAGAQQDFADLQKAIADAKAARDRTDWPTMYEACQRMHETAANKLQAHLPTPDPDLTADLQGAIADATSAANNCLAAQAGALEQLGEFNSHTDQAEKQMRAAQDIINRNLTQT